MWESHREKIPLNIQATLRGGFFRFKKVINMPKRVIIFIDGQNLYHSLRDIGLKEIDINWGKLIKSFLDDEDELKRTYWFRPEKIQEIRLKWYSFARFYFFQHYFDQKEEYIKLLDQNKLDNGIYNKLDGAFNESKKWISSEKQKFSEVDDKYTKIESIYEDLEIYRTGILKIDPYKKLILTEKGVDVALSVKMVKFALQDMCDKVILISGDFDYTEAVQVVKDALKKVHLVKFHKGKPPRDYYTSRKLSAMADKVINIYQTQLESEFKNT